MKKLLFVLLASTFIFASCSSSIGGSSDSEDEKKTTETTTPAETTPKDTVHVVTYTVTIASGITNGTVTASKTTGITAGETITLTITPADGFHVTSYSVKKEETDITVTNNSFTMPAGNVTVSAVFASGYGVKGSEEAKEVGDIVFKDGSATPYTANLTLTNAQKSAAIAIIFYKGTGLNSDAYDNFNCNWGASDTTTVRTLGVGLKHNKNELVWKASANDIHPDAIVCSYDNTTEIFTQDKNGSDNFDKIQNWDTFITNENYPAFYFAKNYKEQKINSEPTSRLVETAFETGWYIPTIAELFQIYACMHDSTNGVNIDTVSEYCGGDKFVCNEQYLFYLSSSLSSAWWQVYCLEFNDGMVCLGDQTELSGYVCVIREFN